VNAVFFFFFFFFVVVVVVESRFAFHWLESVKKSNARIHTRVFYRRGSKGATVKTDSLTDDANDTRRRRRSTSTSTRGIGPTETTMGVGDDGFDARGVESMCTSGRCRRDVGGDVDEGCEAAASMRGRRTWMRGRRARRGRTCVMIAVVIAVMSVVVDAQRFVAMKAPQVRLL
jgi:hypothetical protein